MFKFPKIKLTKQNTLIFTAYLPSMSQHQENLWQSLSDQEKTQGLCQLSEKTKAATPGQPFGCQAAIRGFPGQFWAGSRQARQGVREDDRSIEALAGRFFRKTPYLVPGNTVY